MCIRSRPVQCNQSQERLGVTGRNRGSKRGDRYDVDRGDDMTRDDEYERGDNYDGRRVRPLYYESR